MEKIEKIGELSLVSNKKKYKTDFFATQDVLDELNKKGIAPACLIPDTWLFYEVELFDLLDSDGDGIPDKEFGKKFKVIFYNSFERKDLKQKNKQLSKKIENLKKSKKYLSHEEQKIEHSDLCVNYLLLKK